MKQLLRFVFICLLCAYPFSSFAQENNAWQEKPTLTFSGFADVYYLYDFNQPSGVQRLPFLYNHNRHNAFHLNLGLLKASLSQAKYRANLALQTGTYANDNYVLEPGVLKNIAEANVGISLNKPNTLWLDAGIFASHLGFESAVSTENLTLTRSLSAENSPYFLSGAKLTYTPNKRWEFAGLVVNGWQRIQRLEGNSLLSLGTQITVRPTESTRFNWSTFVGTDDPDSTRRMRYFNNFYGQFQLSEKFTLLTGFDIGVQQRGKGLNIYDTWLSPTLIGQYQWNNRWKTALRLEYYRDATGIIIPTTGLNGFITSGLSVNMDYTPNPYLMCRIEGRWFNSVDPIFETPNNRVNNNFSIGVSIAAQFEALLIGAP
jgi:hypothetical protein